jgi:undecaprenyl pyrophosphate phosphatase UppP
MFAYLVAGLIVGGLIWYLRHEPGDPPIFIQLVVGAIAAGVGGLALNVLLDEDFMAVEPWGFATAAIAAALALAFVQWRGHRGRVRARADASGPLGD